MSKAHISTVRRMLESVLEEATDPEITFKLRTALQLLVLIEEQQAGARSALAKADLDAELRENLRDLGYLD
ncbi:hypothetical protein [Salinigranum salinum]|uniref:hypothetical protein n=1 Tax=Salinigranum salinum TaxID=1364937 RepID=UPI0012610933|nr:hypothetical protein [Salinigranum salinum]